MRAVQLALVVGLTCAASVGVVALGWNAGAGAGTGAGPSGRELVRTRGLLVAVDLAKGTVTLDVQGTALTILAGGEHPAFVGGRFATLAELPLGGQVCAAVDLGAGPSAEWLEPC